MSSIIGRHCPYCQRPISGHDEALVCKVCGTPHHHRCWVEHQGCAVAGCSGTFADAEIHSGHLGHAGDGQETTTSRTEYCPKCGAEIPEGRTACLSCGTEPWNGEDHQGRLPVFKTIIDGFKFAFECFERQGWLLILLHLGITVVAGLMSFPLALLQFLMGIAGVPFVAFPFSIAMALLSIFIQIGVMIIYLKVADGQEAKVNDLFSGGKYLLPFIGANLLVGLGVFVGMILLIIPGLIFALLAVFTPLAVVDRGCGVVDSISLSIRLAGDNFLLTLTLVIVMAILNIMGALFFGIGMLLTVPFSALLEIYCYRKMLHRSR
ncbi:MAG: RING finger protein [Limnochordia bacterium]|nr:RING finger protein [Limnochordia bacterium]